MPRLTIPALAGLLALGALALGAGLYGTPKLAGNSAGGSCRASAATLARMRPLAVGEVAAFQVQAEPAAATPLAFAGPDGAPRTLADLRGRTVLLNLWATWCEPCKREMPALDRLQAELGGPGFEVVAVNLDTRNPERPRAWLDRAGIRHLAYYADPQAKVFQDLRRAGLSEGLPTTLLIDPEGCRLGHLAGWAEWAGPDGAALVRSAIGGPAEPLRRP